MSATSKGKAFEKKIQAFLEERGFTVMRTWPKYGFFKKNGKMIVITTRQDFFGCADLVAIHPKKKHTYFIQCTLTDAAVRREKMEAVPWNLEGQPVFVFKRMEINKQDVKIYLMQRKPFTAGEPQGWSDTIYSFRTKDHEILRCLGI